MINISSSAELMKQILQQRLRHEAVETRTLDQKREPFVFFLTIQFFIGVT